MLAAGFPTTIVPWDLVMSHGRFSPDQLRIIEELDTPQSRFFTRANRASVEYVEKTHGVPGSTHPDSIAAAIAVEPSIITKASDYFVDVETNPGLTQGYMLVDAVRRSGREPNARVIEAIDQDLFFQTMGNALS